MSKMWLDIKFYSRKGWLRENFSEQIRIWSREWEREEGIENVTECIKTRGSYAKSSLKFFYDSKEVCLRQNHLVKI